MKLLKKFLLICLSSFLFCISANALTNSNNVVIPTFTEDVDYHYALYRNTNGRVYITYCSDINSYLTIDIKNDSNIYYTNPTYCISNLNGNITNSITYSLGVNNENITFSDAVIFSNDIIDLSNTSQLNQSSNAIYTYYVDRLSLRSDGMMLNIPNSSFIWNSPILHTNRDIYFYNANGILDEIALNKDVFEVEEEQNVCESTAVLGAVSNVNEIKLNVKGETSALAEPLKGTFTLNYTSVIVLNENNFSVEFVNNSGIEVIGNYNFKCATDSYNCYLNYEYNTSDDISETVDFSFKIRSADNGIMPFIKIYACTTNNDYTYISYDYTNGPNDSITSNPSIENILTDSTPPDISGLVDTSLIGDGPVDSILLLPLNIMNTLLSVLNSNTCRPLVLPLPFVDNNLTLPCISTIYSQIDGLDVFLNWFSAIFSAFILYEYFIRLYKWVDDVITFRENNHFGGF